VVDSVMAYPVQLAEASRELVTSDHVPRRLSSLAVAAKRGRTLDTRNHPRMAGRRGTARSGGGVRGDDQGRTVNQMPTRGDGISNTVHPWGPGSRWMEHVRSRSCEVSTAREQGLDRSFSSVLWQLRGAALEAGRRGPRRR
jgi:hypothetical protein